MREIPTRLYIAINKALKQKIEAKDKARVKTITVSIPTLLFSLPNPERIRSFGETRLMPLLLRFHPFLRKMIPTSWSLVELFPDATQRFDHRSSSNYLKSKKKRDESASSASSASGFQRPRLRASQQERTRAGDHERSDEHRPLGELSEGVDDVTRHSGNRDPRW